MPSSPARRGGYAVWTGIGTPGVAIIPVVLLGDSASPPRLPCIALILAGGIALKLISAN